MAVYSYVGPVMKYDKCICDQWKATTTAPTLAKAKSNLAYRFKKDHGYLPNMRIELPGKIKYIKEDAPYGGVQLKLSQIPGNENWWRESTKTRN